MDRQLKINKMSEFNELNYRPMFSVADINLALEYAANQITIDPSDVGRTVYDILFNEKVHEYLNTFE